MNGTQDGHAANELGGLGHPVHVFIDTSTLERMKFPFGQARLQPFMDRLEAGDIRLVTPEVIVREIREHVSDHVETAQKAHARFRRDAAIARIVDDPGIVSVLTEVDWPRVRRAALAAVDEYTNARGAAVLPIDGEDTPEVFADYFARRAPFGEGKKKSEFPDSFAMKALLRHAQAEGCKIAVISEDQDWQRACADHAELIHCSSVEAAVEHSQTARAALYREIRELLEAHRGALEEAVLASFRDRGFFWDCDAGYDSEVEETYDEEVDSWPWSVIATEGDNADIAGDACVHFRATVNYPDPDSCYRDLDTRELVFLGYAHAMLAATVTVQARVRVSIEALRRNELEFGELTVNDDRDIWFSEDEIEDVYRDMEVRDQ